MRRVRLSSRKTSVICCFLCGGYACDPDYDCGSCERDAQIKDTGNEEDRLKVANEAAYLYAPLAHKLGLYKLKSELEDLSLKYTQKETYYFIKDKLNETKASRDKYIAAFIEPIQRKVSEAGLKFDIKGRTKSIHSIWNKIQKQKTSFEGIYDLFAIRIILDSEPDPAKEKQECWQVYSIVTDMYQPNPKRLRDWLSIPKAMVTSRCTSL